MRMWVAIVSTMLLAALAIPEVASAGTVFVVDGQGWGHGVGLSQWGAEGYARHGYSYRQILAHYYPHTHIGLAGARTVRVLLLEKRPAIRVASSAPFLVVDASGRRRHLRSLLVRATASLPLQFEAGAQPLRVAGVAYRGDVIVKRKPGGLMAVNVLSLDMYLRGVVPWEVPDGWQTATYEAQVVAARSYTLATLHPGEDFDFYPDARSQMYGGVAAERTATNIAVGATAGQVLVWHDTIVQAFYFSTSGGRTSSVHDAWPRAQQVPYLVSVSDPYDGISPRHTWPTKALTPAAVGRKLHLGGVRDVRVTYNGSKRARSVRVLTTTGWKSFAGTAFQDAFNLGSTAFQVHAMSLLVPRRALTGAHVSARGWVRGLPKVLLQAKTAMGWRTVRRIRPTRNGTFSVSLPARTSTSLRLSAEGVAGPVAAFHVARR
jgi:stage II sporulation protein D